MLRSLDNLLYHLYKRLCNRYAVYASPEQPFMLETKCTVRNDIIRLNVNADPPLEESIKYQLSRSIADAIIDHIQLETVPRPELDCVDYYTHIKLFF